MSYIDGLDRAKVDAVLVQIKERAAADNSIAKSCLDYGNGNDDFAVWMWLVTRRMLDSVGVTPFDIADFRWRDSFDNGDSPSAAYREALEEDDTFSAFVGE